MFKALDEEVKRLVTECQGCHEPKDECNCRPTRRSIVIMRRAGWQPRPLVLFRIIGSRGGHHSGSYRSVL